MSTTFKDDVGLDASGIHDSGHEMVGVVEEPVAVTAGVREAGQVPMRVVGRVDGRPAVGVERRGVHLPVLVREAQRPIRGSLHTHDLSGLQLDVQAAVA